MGETDRPEGLKSRKSVRDRELLLRERERAIIERERSCIHRCLSTVMTILLVSQSVSQSVSPRPAS